MLPLMFFNRGTKNNLFDFDERLESSMANLRIQCSSQVLFAFNYLEEPVPPQRIDLIDLQLVVGIKKAGARHYILIPLIPAII